MTMKKFIIGAVCCFIIATGSGVAEQHTTYAATQNGSAAIQSTSAQKKAAIVAFAQRLKGKVKYKFGVNNPGKLWFDCSSFTQYVFASQGIKLKWGSVAQSQQGNYVSKSNLKTGDLLFFGSGSSKKISHVGIYMGNGQFIHNTIGSSINGVMINDLSDYSKRYITARRVE